MQQKTGVRGQRGITGLETAIVLIAFVVVASVFAFTILSAGVFSAEANKQTIHAGLSETRTLLRQHSSTFAYAGRLNTTDVVFKVTFIVSNSLAGEPIDLTPPYTADDTGTDPDFDSTASPGTIISYSDENQRLLDVPWTVRFIGNHNGDRLLEDGEKAEITLWLMDRDMSLLSTQDDSVMYMDGIAGGGGEGGIDANGTLIVKSTRFTLEVTPEKGAALTVQRTIPPGLRQVMNLR
ncbi:MAG: archaellin/type IV pilin N-terminal domain-containing protein [Dehalococcoidia bacterium]